MTGTFTRRGPLPRQVPRPGMEAGFGCATASTLPPPGDRGSAASPGPSTSGSLEHDPIDGSPGGWRLAIMSTAFTSPGDRHRLRAAVRRHQAPGAPLPRITVRQRRAAAGRGPPGGRHRRGRVRVPAGTRPPDVLGFLPRGGDRDRRRPHWDSSSPVCSAPRPPRPRRTRLPVAARRRRPSSPPISACGASGDVVRWLPSGRSGSAMRASPSTASPRGATCSCHVGPRSARPDGKDLQAGVTAARVAPGRVADGLARASIVANCVIVVTGGVVRLTGSGQPHLAPGAPRSPFTPTAPRRPPGHRVRQPDAHLVLVAVAVGTFVAAGVGSPRPSTTGAGDGARHPGGRAVIGGIGADRPQPLIVSPAPALLLWSSSGWPCCSCSASTDLPRTPAGPGGWVASTFAAAWAVLYVGTVVRPPGPHDPDRNGLSRPR